MNILVVGGGHLGRSIAFELDKLGHDIAIIEESADNLSLLSPKFGGVTFNTFPMDINNLKDAGIENCDAVAVTTTDDNLNITVGQIAKTVFGIETVVARISDPLRENIFENFGLKTVCPTNMSAHSIITSITSPYEQKSVAFGTNLVGFRLALSDKRHYDRRLSNIASYDDESIFGLIRADGKFLLNKIVDCPRINQGDTIVFAKKID